MEQLEYNLRFRWFVGLGIDDPVGLMRKPRHGGRARVGWMFTFTAAAHKLVRIQTLAPKTVP